MGAIDGTNPTLTFDAGGNAILQSGCNTARTTWKLDGSRLTIEPASQTRMQCDQPAGAMSQEAALIAALESAARVDISPDSLTILDDKGLIALIATR